MLVFVLLLGSFPLFCNFSANALAQFLNVNKPIDAADVLLVEGWFPERLLGHVREEFSKGTYRYVLVSGMDSVYVTDPEHEKKIYSDASRVAHDLINLGVDSSKIKIVSCPSTNIHKTFSMALATRKWVSVNDPTIRRINIVTAWSHGRKTWRAYQRVLGDSTVGIFTFPKRRLPIAHWWLTRGGLGYQVYSLVGYVYAALWPMALLDTSG